MPDHAVITAVITVAQSEVSKAEAVAHQPELRKSTLEFAWTYQGPKPVADVAQAAY